MTRWYVAIGTVCRGLADTVKEIQADTQSSPPKVTDSKKKDSKERPKKRASVEKASAPRKRQKIAQQEKHASEELSSSLSDVDSEAVEEKPKRAQKKAPAQSRSTKQRPPVAKKARTATPDSEEEDEANSTGAVDPSDQEKETQGTIKPDDDGSDSELSVLLDDDP